jgi:hypothetical protein
VRVSVAGSRRINRMQNMNCAALTVKCRGYVLPWKQPRQHVCRNRTSATRKGRRKSGATRMQQVSRLHFSGRQSEPTPHRTEQPLSCACTFQGAKQSVESNSARLKLALAPFCEARRIEERMARIIGAECRRQASVQQWGVDAVIMLTSFARCFKWKFLVVRITFVAISLTRN